MNTSTLALFSIPLLGSLLSCTPVTGAETMKVQPFPGESEPSDELKNFPPAGPGQERYVITLPVKERDEEGEFKVELVAGKTQLTDGVNLYRLDNAIQPRDLQGWGYTYYEVTGSGLTRSTLMAPPEGQPQVERFVGSQPLLIDYNSRLPIVIYAPEGYEIKYRLWSASPKYQHADKG